MRLGSGEHLGWERPRTAELVDVVAEGAHPGEFAQLRVPAGAKGGPLDVMVRERVSPTRPWRRPARGERMQVQAWVLDADDAAVRALAVELDEPQPWSPPKPAPDLWLWVEG